MDLLIIKDLLMDLFAATSLYIYKLSYCYVLPVALMGEGEVESTADAWNLEAH